MYSVSSPRCSAAGPSRRPAAPGNDPAVAAPAGRIGRRRSSLVGRALAVAWLGALPLLSGQAAPGERLAVAGKVVLAGSNVPARDATVELRWPGNEDRFQPVVVPVREDGSYRIDVTLPTVVTDAGRLTVTAIVPGRGLVEIPLRDAPRDPDSPETFALEFAVESSTLDTVLDIFSCCILNWAVLTVMLPAFLLGAAITCFVPGRYLLALLGPQAPRHKAYFAAVGSGMVLSLCSCNVVPLFLSIWRVGAGAGPAFAFLYAGPAINLVSMVFTCQVIGLPIGIFRIAAVAIIAVSTGLLMEVFCGSVKRVATMALPSDGDDDLGPRSIVALLSLLLYLLVLGSIGMSLPVRLGLMLPALGTLAWLCIAKLGRRHMAAWMRETWSLLRKVIPVLVPAVVLIGFLAQAVPLSVTRWMSGNNSLAGNAGAAVFGALMYFPILTEVAFVKALLKIMGAGIGPALALLLTAPGLSLPGMVIVARDIGWRRVLTYVACIVVLSTLTGMLFGSQWGAYICSCIW